MRTWLVLLLVVLSRPSVAIEPGTYDYRIHHSVHGDIGTHRMSVTEGQGSRLIIEHTADIEVKVLSIPVYTRTAELHEVWEEGRLVRFDARIDDDGEIRKVKARAHEDALVIEGANGVVRAPADAAPAQPSFEGAIGRTTFFKVATGETYEAEVADTSAGTLEIGGNPRPVTRYTFTGGRDDRVWFGPDGLWVRWELEPGGGTVTLVRDDVQN